MTSLISAPLYASFLGKQFVNAILADTMRMCQLTYKEQMCLFNNGTVEPVPKKDETSDARRSLGGMSMWNAIIMMMMGLITFMVSVSGLYEL